MKFGLHNNSFLTATGSPREIWPELKERVQWLDAIGFDYLSVMDHLWQIPGVGSGDEPFMEAWTTLGAIAVSTERLELTTMVTAVGYRNPALLAKIATTLDVLSGGRAILGIGGGWFEAEYEGYGYPFPRPGTRLGQLRDAVRLAKAMWRDAPATYEGRHFVAREAILEPKPLQSPRPRILVGGVGEQLTLRIAAEEADMCNLMMATPDVFAHKLDVLKRHLDRAGKPVDEIEVTKLDRLCLAATPEKAWEKWNARGGRLPKGYPSMVGSPDEVVERLRAFEAQGCQAVFFSVANSDRETLGLFADEVMPAFA